MSGKELLEGMSYVDERFVDEAENRAIGKGSAVQWKRWMTVAACLCIFLIGIISAREMLPFSSGNSSETAAGDQLMGQENALEDGAEVIPDQEAISLTLRIEAVQEGGFTGTVAALEGSDVFLIGMELNVVVESDNDALPQGGAGSKKVWETGSLVQVWVVSYDAQTNTAVVNLLEVIEEPIID